jgi:two-component system sensor histidine kinase SenX3
MTLHPNLVPELHTIRGLNVVSARPQPARRQPVDAGLLDALTIIAHDLRGPLANLSVLLELIEAHAQVQSYDRVKPCAEKALDIVSSLDGMIRAFLQRTREHGDPLAFSPALVDLGEVVRRAADLNRPIGERRAVAFDLTGVRPLVVEGDERLLIEALDNIMSNSVAPAGSTVSCTVEASGREAAIHIRDEGKGLDELALKRAFRPFAASSARSRLRGTSFGLGLWIVRLIVERHGGRIEVETGRARAGTSFAITLPLEGK